MAREPILTILLADGQADVREALRLLLKAEGIAAAARLVTRSLSVLLVTLPGNGGAFNPVVVAGVGVVLTLAGLLACLFPAIRASRVPPMRALRGE